MNQEEFRRGVMEQLHATHALLLKLTNQDYCNQSLLMALAEQPGLNREKLAEDYEDNLLDILEHVHPAQQRRETYDRFREALRQRLAMAPGRPSAG